MSNQFRTWLDEQPRSMTQARIAEALDVHPSYISDLSNPRNTTMPSLPVAVKLSRLTEGKVTPEAIYEGVMENRGRLEDMV